MLGKEFFARNVADVARDLIGVTLRVDGVGGPIVEVEAYDRRDPASHAYRGRTIRNAVMFDAPGYAYVYRSYGIHWCVNFVCGGEPVGNAVLIRALQPLYGLDEMMARRGLEEPRDLCSGPGRLCQALGITHDLNGAALDQPPFELEARVGDWEIAVGPRIGITKGVETPWRFGQAGSRFVSKPFR
jgi:DNA-3-methyladenine glycosylase